MTALAKCKDCAAITLDTDDDARKHREWHRDYDSKFRNTRTAAIEARDALGGLRAEIKDLRDAWDEAPEPIEPDQLVVTDMRDDDELGLTDSDDQRSQYSDDEQTDPDPILSSVAALDDDDQLDDNDLDPDDEEDEPLRDPVTNYFSGPTIR